MHTLSVSNACIIFSVKILRLNQSFNLETKVFGSQEDSGAISKDLDLGFEALASIWRYKFQIVVLIARPLQIS